MVCCRRESVFVSPGVNCIVFPLCVRVGQEPSDKVVDQMMSEAPGPLNFTMFLTLFGEKLNGGCTY